MSLTRRNQAGVEWFQRERKLEAETRVEPKVAIDEMHCKR